MSLDRRTRTSASLTGAVLLLAATAIAAQARAQALGDFDGHGDVGGPRLAGSARYDTAAQEYTLTGAGTNMWFARDELHLAWKRMKGDFIVQARLSFQGKGVNAHRKAGVIVRASLEPDAPYADAAVHGDGLTSLQFRRAAAANTEELRSQTTGADVVQLERKGTVVTVSVARFGETYETSRVSDLALGDEVYVGLFVCSHEAEVAETVSFKNVRLVRPAPDTFVPYRDYIGSRLEILDVESGDRRVIHASEDPFEAPNWTPDGKALIYNTSGASRSRGRLVRFDLASRQGTLVDTGFAVANNNDHVLSFDGKQLGISDHTTGDHQSVVYTLPASGGVPKRITRLSPSYMHGWSPDGRFLVYAGGRDDEFDVFWIAADGSGDETNLTRHPGLDDGPEYSPDGRWIYFNSVRSGLMQIWRMKPDGSAPEQVTNDGFNNWFPHLSPDGKWIAYIAFPKEITPSDHPYYKRVYLMLMPASGGPARVIAYVYGGQGTINVPSWAPDGRRLAFVSNSAQP
jgi:TolB protein